MQWSSFVYPATAVVAPVTLRYFNTFVQQVAAPGTNASTLLENCYATWNWHSCGSGSTINLGSQLLVGTVFGSDVCSLDYTTVQVAVKYRVNLAARFSFAEISVNDSSGIRRGTAFTATLGDNEWKVACASHPISDFENVANLRVLATFLGTTTVANVGATVVDIEWFMIHLS